MLLRPNHQFEKGNYAEMKKILNETNWEVILNNLCVDKMWQELSSTRSHMVDRHVPKKKEKNGGKRVKPLWMNNDTRKKVKKKFNSWKRYTEIK